MKLEETKKLINNVIENEFNHIQETQEREESLSDIEIDAHYQNSSDLLDELLKIAPEHSELIEKLDSELSSYWLLFCRYYFKKGVVAGTTNLKFLENTEIMEYV